MEDDQNQYLGEFRIDEKDFPGLVTIKGSKSEMELYSTEPIHIPTNRMGTIQGVARTGEKITICGAI
ncbi:MAG TPA: hypothetical protein VGH13_15885, partial [Xanthobacteraceae bacterium]